MQLIDLVPDLRPTILAARQLTDDRLSLARYLPVQVRQSVSYRLGRRRRLDQTVPVRAIDAPATPIRRPGVVTVQGDLPAVTPIVDLSEQDLTTEMILAQQLATGGFDWQPVLTSAAAEATITAHNTFEAMRGQVLATLGLALEAADGAVHEVDFGATADQVYTVTDPWSGGGALADFTAAHNQYKEVAGQPAGVALTTDRVKGALLADLQVKYPQSPVDLNTLNAYLSANGLPGIETYDRRFVGEDGSRTRVYPEGHLTFLPGEGDPVGRTELGVTQEAVQQTMRVQPNGRTALTSPEAAGLTIVTLGRDNPVQRSVKAAAIGMPVVHDIDQIVVVQGIFG